MPATVTKPKRINYVLGATLVQSGMTYEEAAQQTGACNGNSLRRGLARKGVTSTRVRALPAERLITGTVTAQVASQAADLLKEQFNRILTKHVESLEHIPAKRNIKHLKQIGQVIEPLARTYRTVNPEQAKSSLVNVNVLSSIQSWDDLPSVSVAPLLHDSETVPDKP